MFDLGPDLSDDILIELVRTPTRIRNAVKYAGLKTMGDLPRNHGRNVCKHSKSGIRVGKMVARTAW